MKRKVIIIFAILSMVTLQGCTINQSNTKNTETTTAQTNSQLQDGDRELVANEPEHSYDTSLIENTKDVPSKYYNSAKKQGKIDEIQYKAIDRAGNGEEITKKALIYTPYGYNEKDDTKKYNIIYMLHGWTGTAETFFQYDDSNALKNVLDNMIENGDIDPVIVVTPTFDRNNKSTSLDDSIAEMKLFHKELTNELMPAVESKYNTYAENTDKIGFKNSRNHRAFGGFSLGAAATWNVFLNDMDYFKYYMPLSGGCWVIEDQATDIEVLKKTADYIENYIKNSGYKNDDYFVYTAVGSKDVAFDMTNNLVSAISTKKNIFNDSNFKYNIQKGAIHWWEAVPEDIYNALPNFF